MDFSASSFNVDHMYGTYDKDMALYSRPKYILHENRLLCSKKVIAGIVASKLLFSNMAIVAEYWKENSVQNAEEEFSYQLRNPINSRIHFIIGTSDEDIALHISDLS